jgi:very-short-patch-repair endonuclease
MLSHQSAAEAFGFVSVAWSGKIHVTVPRHCQPAGIPGVAVHRVNRAQDMLHPSLLPPRTRVEETVIDLTQSAHSVDEAFDWLCRAVGGRLTTAERLRQAMGRRARMRWRTELVGSVATVDDGVRSNLEHRYVRDVERPHGLPRAARQVRVVRSGRTCYLDNLYEKHLVCIELDGRVAHPPADRWRDFRRDNAGLVEGIVTLRFGWSDITRWPCATAGQVAAVLRQRGWTGQLRTCGPNCRLPLS